MSQAGGNLAQMCKLLHPQDRVQHTTHFKAHHNSPFTNSSRHSPWMAICSPSPPVVYPHRISSTIDQDQAQLVLWRTSHLIHALHYMILHSRRQVDLYSHAMPLHTQIIHSPPSLHHHVQLSHYHHNLHHHPPTRPIPHPQTRSPPRTLPQPTFSPPPAHPRISSPPPSAAPPSAKAAA